MLSVDEDLTALLSEDRDNETGSSDNSVGSVVSDMGGNGVGHQATLSVKELAAQYDTSYWKWEAYFETLLGAVASEENNTDVPRVVVQVMALML